MKRIVHCYLICFILLSIALTSCSDLSSSDVETLLTDAKVYPLNVEYKMFCNGDEYVQEVIKKKLVENGFVTAQIKHTMQDMGKPLIYFTDKATPYLIPTSDTLKSFDIQRIRMAEEVFLHVQNIEINPSGNKAVVDYSTKIVNPTPFIVLYDEEVEGEKKRRTFFTRKDNKWTWDGKIIKMLK